MAKRIKINISDDMREALRDAAVIAFVGANAKIDRKKSSRY